ncbi:GNAT family N-acetyltransferase [Rhodococcus sp. WMMA185]|uniref:GNAT family N-acetyltransferase n=1 Tax=Rhodococcus sp. WMMA185 TaxID=679318 RepID=UPI0008784547|nr:GNAT family N-acetyltransferase [Rhodococcus sp. WMMA185]AOW92402.1 GNAT family N-acetyltransferase [Rhodococcus sp. WMMA185]
MAAVAALKRSWALDLDTETLYRLLELRVEVFVVEQACPYPELDGRDLLAPTRHFWLEQDGRVVCSLRLLEEHEDGKTWFRIGRVCTANDARGQGHATRLLSAALAEVGDALCRIDAQNHLEDMYARHGFKQDGEWFVEDGILHVPMCRGGGAAFGDRGGAAGAAGEFVAADPSAAGR